MTKISKPNLLALSIAAVLASVVVYMIYVTSNQPPVRASASTATNSPLIKPHSPALSPARIQVHTGTGEKEAGRPSNASERVDKSWGALLKPNTQKTDLLAVDPYETGKHLDKVAAKAGAGDGEAALALYRFADSCGVLDDYGKTRQQSRQPLSEPCRAILAMTTSPRDWLLLAAQRTDSALVPLVGVANELARHGGDKVEAAQMAVAAIAALEQSARRGNPDAYVNLGNMYSRGTIVQSDPVKAYAYYDAYAKAFQDAAVAAQLETLRPLIRQADWAAIAALQAELANSVYASVKKEKEPKHP